MNVSLGDLIKTYKGERINGELVVTVAGRPLPVHDACLRYAGERPRFECGGNCCCPDAKRLALAILLDYHDKPLEAKEWATDFAQRVIAKLDTHKWTLTAEDIEAAIEKCMPKQFSMDLQSSVEVQSDRRVQRQLAM